MRAKGRQHGRFVALSGIKKVKAPPESRFPLIIIDSTGLPIFPLCEWYRRKKEYDDGRTPDTYLEMILPYFGFLSQKGYAWNEPPERVRAFLVEFLRTDVGCQVSPGREDGYHVETTGASPLSKSSLTVLLAALTSLYGTLSEAGYYPFENPMRSQRLISLRQEHIARLKNPGAPDHAGIRSETHQETHQAYPTTFFRQKRRKVWEPEVVMESDVVQEQMRKTIDYMVQHAPFQRDQVILLLLRQTGARLSEVVEMTAGGYRKAQHAGRSFVKNKGSRGREEKIIYFTDTIENQLLSYIRSERAQYDPHGYTRLEQLNDRDPIFLTETGKPYTRSAFYYHWYRLFEPAQKHFKKQERVAFSPHDIRHLQVTRNVLKIKQQTKGEKELEEELLHGFSQLMGWRNHLTMDTYIHTLNKRKALLDILLAEDAATQTEASDHVLQVTSVPDPLTPPRNMPAQTNQLFFDDEDSCSWYEE
jgi:hypothetical protein